VLSSTAFSASGSFSSKKQAYKMLAKKEMIDETRNWLLKREEMAAEHLMEKAVAKYANEYAKYERNVQH
jgi:hypothetical protein